jgi:hypothetical protein
MAAFLAGQIVTADQLTNLATEGTYVPVLAASTTDPNLGDDGIADGQWHRNGRRITEWIYFQFAGANVSNGSGSYRFQPNFLIDFSRYTASTTFGSQLGSCYLVDDETTDVRNIGFITLFSATGNGLLLFRLESLNFVDHDSPWVWAAGDVLVAEISYLADPAGLP